MAFVGPFVLTTLSWTLCLLPSTILGFAGMPEESVLLPKLYKNCTDFRGHSVAHGERYWRIDMCTSCTCDDGDHNSCQSVLCSAAPSGCEAVDDKCCEFNCVNSTNVETKDTDTLNTTNLGLRLVASTVTSFLILALLLFMIHRLRQRRLLLMIRRINGSQVSGGPYGPRRFSVDEDGSVGYLTGQDQVDFGTYDEPPPPYTFWKPPEAYFTHEEAPPPYEASQQQPPPPPPPPSHPHIQQHHNNDRNRDNNAVNLGHHHHHHHHHPHQTVSGVGCFTVPPSALLTPPYASGMAGAVFPIHCSQRPGAYGAPPPQHHVYAHSPSLPAAGIIPSLTQVSLRTNNFQMNNLDQESSEPNARRHSVPLNVVGSSRSSLNSSQSGELNESLAEPTVTTNITITAATITPASTAIRSDAIYVGCSAGMIPPLVPTTVTTGSSTSSSRTSRPEVTPPTGQILLINQPRTETTSTRDRPVSTVVIAHDGLAPIQDAQPAKYHSCGDVLDGWQQADEHRRWKREVAARNRRSLQPRYYLDADCGSSATAWLADGSVSSSSSSSSSPTYERGTLSPTSSDSSSIDYNFGGQVPRAEPRRTHSESQFTAGGEVATCAAPSVASVRCAGGRKSGSGSSLDRTLDALRAKMSLKKSKKKTAASEAMMVTPPAPPLQPLPQSKGTGNKLRHLLAGFGGGTTAPDSGERQVDVLQPLNGRHPRRCSTSEVATMDDRGPFAHDDYSVRPTTETVSSATEPVLNSFRPRSLLQHHQHNRPSEDEQCPSRAPRISYVSDGDAICANDVVSEVAGGSGGGGGDLVPIRPRVLNLNRRHRGTGQPRPRSYDFADLSVTSPASHLASSATYSSIAEEGGGGGAASTPPTRSDEPPSTTATLTTDATVATTTDCCCSLASSLDSSFDCSSRASFGSSGSVSREGPATPGSSDVSPAATTAAFPSLSSPPPQPAPPRVTPRVPMSVLARSGSVCSETGERRHSRHQSPALVHASSGTAGTASDHQVRIESATVTALPTAATRINSVGATAESVQSNAAAPPSRSCSAEATEGTDRSTSGGSMSASGANRIRVTVGPWSTNESFI